MVVKPPCEVEGCESLAYRRTFCCKHYERNRRYGDVNFVHKKWHGGADTPTHRIWRSMKQRCINPNDRTYKHYGGRGIKVCDRWLGADGYTNFLSDMGERPEGLTLDRIDSNSDYEPSNCRWATRQEQTDNRRMTIRYRGLLTREWADVLGVSLAALRSAIRRHGGLEKAVERYQERKMLSGGENVA